MKRNHTYMVLILVGIMGCNSAQVKNSSATVEPSSQSKNSKVLSINVDEELELIQNKEELRSSKDTIIEGSLFMHDNDEVSFKGDLLDKNSPITIKVGDNDEVSFTGNSYKINSMELQHGDLIEMKDKNGKVFLEMEIIK